MSCSNLFWDLVVHNIFKISTLSTVDYVNIVGNYNHSASGSKQQVAADLDTRGYSPEVLAMVRRKAVADFQPVTSCGLKFTKHLSSFKYPLFSYILTLFENYERGLLPFEGSISDQPSQVIEIFSLLQNLKYEREKKLTEKKK